VTQLPSATELDVTLNRTCTDLICNTHRRTNASVSLARFYQPLAGFYASETLADLSGETPEFRVLEFYCIIWIYEMSKV